ncbi:hypothetical protein [Gordonia shandongensis]|uniref:hypothetical protein n=1 Tax=Gordonia shandongensis TaxID=376351 RepID=UPI000419860B|nr:hypothetical protein [Gordonia shandongensis]
MAISVRSWRSRAARAVAVTLVGAVVIGSVSQSVSAAPGEQRATLQSESTTQNVADGPGRQAATKQAAERTPPTTVTADGATCVGAEEATLDKVFVAVFDSFMPSIPAEHRGAARAAKRQVLADMHRMTISTTAVSMHPTQLGASDDAPMNTYRDPLSQWIVTQLMNVREGRAAQPIRVENLTLSQAVETAWLYFYLTAIIPLTFVKDTMPGLVSVGPVALGTLITLPITIGAAGLKLMYRQISDAIIGGCLVTMTPQERARAGKPEPGNFSSQVPAIIEDIAGQVMIAEPGTCPAIGDLPLKRIVARTSAYLQAIAPNARAARQIAAKQKELDAFMRQVRVPENLIPADPADFTTIETLLSYGLGAIPYVGGAITEIAIGIGHTIGEGKDLGKTVRLADLTVTKTMTAAYYAYALTTHFISVANDFAADALAPMTGGIDLLPRADGLINAPNTYGLVVYHNVLRSLCLAEDQQTGKAPATTRW